MAAGKLTTQTKKATPSQDTRSQWHQDFNKRNAEIGARQKVAMIQADIDKKKKKARVDAELSRQRVGGPIPADTRYAKVLASIYDDPFMKMLIQAGAIAPASY